jgi:hypothetical protein
MLEVAESSSLATEKTSAKAVITPAMANPPSMVQAKTLFFCMAGPIATNCEIELINYWMGFSHILEFVKR